MMMIEGYTATKAEVLYGAGCHLVTYEDWEFGTNSSKNNMTVFNATLTKVTTDGTMKHNHKINSLHHYHPPMIDQQT